MFKSFCHFATAGSVTSKQISAAGFVAQQTVAIILPFGDFCGHDDEKTWQNARQNDKNGKYKPPKTKDLHAGVIQW